MQTPKTKAARRFNIMAESQPLSPAWNTGRNGDYYWLETTEHDIDSMLRLCPEAVLDFYFAVTSIDSGILHLDEEQKSEGWESRNEIAYSPKIVSVKELPHEGFDEWYVFESPTELGKLFRGNVFDGPAEPGHIKVFANFLGFSLHDPDQGALAALLWQQLEWARPFSYIADTDSRLICILRDEKMFEAVRKALTPTEGSSV
jgi:hypothetical protein